MIYFLYDRSRGYNCEMVGVMGKKRAISIRRLAEKLIKTYPDSFTDNFEENKKLVGEMIDFPSKAVRNKVTGYILRLKRIKLTTPLPTIPSSTEEPLSRGRRRRRRR